MCLYPRLIKNRKYIGNKKNGGKPPPVLDKRTEWVPVGCGNCIECRKQKARGWQVRLLEDIKDNRNGKFITLTFNNESIKEICKMIEEDQGQITGYELDNEIATKAVRLFLERWRKKYKKSLRHWLVTELGHNGTENIHLHGIVWTDEEAKQLEKIWMYGFVWIGQYVNQSTVNYIVKYITKVDKDHKLYKSKTLTSPGIGANYLDRQDWKRNQFNGTETNELYRTSTGHKIAMPIYWRNKIYSEKEKEQLWLQRLDKNERWVCGEKVKADNTKEYFKLLEWHRERSKTLGYGDDEKTWEQEEYERQRRIMMMEKRLK